MNNTIREFGLAKEEEGLHLLKFIKFKQGIFCTFCTLQGNYEEGITLLK